MHALLTPTSTPEGASKENAHFQPSATPDILQPSASAVKLFTSESSSTVKLTPIARASAQTPPPKSAARPPKAPQTPTSTIKLNRRAPSTQPRPLHPSDTTEASTDLATPAGFRAVLKHVRREMLSEHATWESRCVGLRLFQQAIGHRFQLSNTLSTPQSLWAFTATSASHAYNATTSVNQSMPGVAALTSSALLELRTQLAASQLMWNTCLGDTMTVAHQACTVLSWVASLLHASSMSIEESTVTCDDEWADSILASLLAHGASTRPAMKEAALQAAVSVWARPAGNSAWIGWSASVLQSVFKVMGEPNGKNEGARLMTMDVCRELFTVMNASNRSKHTARKAMDNVQLLIVALLQDASDNIRVKARALFWSWQSQSTMSITSALIALMPARVSAELKKAAPVQVDAETLQSLFPVAAPATRTPLAIKADKSVIARKSCVEAPSFPSPHAVAAIDESELMIEPESDISAEEHAALEAAKAQEKAKKAEEQRIVREQLKAEFQNRQLNAVLEAGGESITVLLPKPSKPAVIVAPSIQIEDAFPTQRSPILAVAPVRLESLLEQDATNMAAAAVTAALAAPEAVTATARKRVRVQEVQSPPAGQSVHTWSATQSMPAPPSCLKTPRVLAPCLPSPMLDQALESHAESARRLSFTTPFKEAAKDTSRTPGRSILRRRVPLAESSSPASTLASGLPFANSHITKSHSHGRGWSIAAVLALIVVSLAAGFLLGSTQSALPFQETATKASSNTAQLTAEDRPALDGPRVLQGPEPLKELPVAESAVVVQPTEHIAQVAQVEISNTIVEKSIDSAPAPAEVIVTETPISQPVVAENTVTVAVESANVPIVEPVAVSQAADVKIEQSTSEESINWMPLSFLLIAGAAASVYFTALKSAVVSYVAHLVPAPTQASVQPSFQVQPEQMVVTEQIMSEAPAANLSLSPVANESIDAPIIKVKSRGKSVSVLPAISASSTAGLKLDALGFYETASVRVIRDTRTPNARKVDATPVRRSSRVREPKIGE